MNRKQNKLTKEIFQMVYIWGRLGIKTDANSFAYKTMIGQLLGNESNGLHKIRQTYAECFILNCKRKKHLSF